MAEYDEYVGLTIHTGFLAYNLFTDTTGINVEASARRYLALYEEALARAFPGAEVYVDLQWAEGSIPWSLRTWADRPDGRTNETDAELAAICESVDAIGGRVYEDGDWLVEA